ncbi:MAG: GlsB/YeaQ/YmgE family stress response membrane protein [Rhizobiales bacterium]|nr:GlsB/YeaQ/YmgE family stress response membrane protein [Hyphomicrobiales bacterium]
MEDLGDEGAAGPEHARGEVGGGIIASIISAVIGAVVLLVIIGLFRRA